MVQALDNYCIQGTQSGCHVVGRVVAVGVVHWVGLAVVGVVYWVEPTGGLAVVGVVYWVEPTGGLAVVGVV